tara:strand:+ start:220 stop:648 length:429 start_codon:yes stop_codon:yes gene_type:complete
MHRYSPKLPNKKSPKITGGVNIQKGDTFYVPCSFFPEDMPAVADVKKNSKKMTEVYVLSVTPTHVLVMYYGYHDISEHMERHPPGAPMHTHMNRYSHRLKLQDVKKLGIYGDFGKRKRHPVSTVLKPSEVYTGGLLYPYLTR